MNKAGCGLMGTALNMEDNEYGKDYGRSGYLKNLDLKTYNIGYNTKLITAFARIMWKRLQI